MKRDEVNVGDSVCVKDGVEDFDTEINLSGWQGRVTALYVNGGAEVAWDSITLRGMMPELVVAFIEEELPWDTYELDPKDQELASPRDTEDDVAQVVAEIQADYGMTWLEGESELTREVLGGTGAHDTYGQLLAWEAYMEAHMTFPFEAVMLDSDERSPVQAGDRLRVHAIMDADDFYGIIFKVRKGRKQYYIPACQIDVIEEPSINHAIIRDYSDWFVNH
jgi:hypothetical protein